MKRFITFLFAIIFLLPVVSWGQSLLLEENFDYSIGSLITVTTNWSESPTGQDVYVVINNLSYSNYPSSDIGKKIYLDSPGSTSNRGGIVRIFTTSSSGTIYLSFLMNISSTTDMDVSTSSGDYFANLKVSGSNSFRSVLFVRQGSSSSKFQIGLGKLNTSTPTWYGTELDINTTYLIATAYVFQSGNDVAKLWINPALSGSEPSADIEQSSGTDAANLGEIQFRQNAKSGDIYIDGIRVSDSWSLAPLPVELTSFTAMLADNGVRLNWETATEVNNYGFEILRSSQDDIWEKIGFVQGHGNSNSPKSYSFMDESAPAGKVLYRIKQIDFDGKFEYSNVTEVNVEVPGKLVLYQNMPNPFNPATEIKFALPKSSNVELSIYNMLGEKIKTIASGIMNAGEHKVSFNAANLSSGVYFYKLTTESNSSIKKMILMK